MDVRSLRRAVVRRLVALRAWVTWSPRRAGTLVGVCLTVLLVSPLAAGSRGRGRVRGSAEAADAGRGADPVRADSLTVHPRPDARRHRRRRPAPNEDAARCPRRSRRRRRRSAQRFASLWLAGAFVRTAALGGQSLRSRGPVAAAVPRRHPGVGDPAHVRRLAVPQLVAPSYGVVRVIFADGTGMDLQMSGDGFDLAGGAVPPTATP